MPSRWIVYTSVPGHLIGFLSVLAATLAVTLSGESAVAADRPAGYGAGVMTIGK